jgi:hypothetical protein
VQAGFNKPAEEEIFAGAESDFWPDLSSSEFDENWLIYKIQTSSNLPNCETLCARKQRESGSEF